MAKIKTGLKRGIFLFSLAAIALPIVVIGSMFLHYEKRAMLEVIDRQNLILASAISNDINNFLAGPVYTANNLAALVTKQDLAPHINELLSLQVVNDGFFESIMVLNKHGIVQNMETSSPDTVNRGDFLGLDLSQSEHVAAALRLHRPIWSDTYISPFTNEPTLSLTYPFSNGLIVGNVNLGYLSGIVKTMSSKSTSQVYVVNEKGRIIAHPAKIIVQEQVNISTNPAVQSGLSGHEGSFDYVVGGKRLYGVVKKIPSTGWLVVVEQDRDAFMRQLRITEMVLWTFLVMVLVFIACLTAYINARVLKPVAAISRATRHIADGSFQALPNVDAKYRELEELSTNVNEMVTALQQRELALNKRNEELRYEVARRTQSEAKFTKVFQSVPVLISLTALTDGIYLDVNEESLRVSGFSRDEVIGHNAVEIGWITRENSRMLVKELETRGRIEGIEMDFRAKDGQSIIGYVKGERVTIAGRSCLLIVTLDITERRRTEQAFLQEKAFSDAVIESLPGIFYICDEQGKLLRWNTNEKEVTGYSMEELSRMHITALFQKDRNVIIHKLQEVMDTGRAFVEASIVTKSGLPIPFFLTGCLMVRDGKRYVVGVGIDISEKKQLEQQLLQAQKMEAIGQLAGGVAHDFNNILTAIIGYGSVLQMKMAANDPLRVNVDHMLESAGRATELTQSLLAFGRKQVLNMKAKDLNEIIARQEKFLRRVIGEEIEMRTTLRNDAVIMADSGQIEQVLMNLATNARDAMPKGGRLTVETDLLDMSGAFISAHGFGTPGKYAVISVTDTGMGMDWETQQKIFEPFFTTKEVGRGTGLGMAIVYGIVKQHKGYIDVYSQVGKGTTFKLYFPVHRGPVEQSEETKEASVATTGSETLLLAEDDATVRAFFCDILMAHGYTVIVAENGEDAIRKFTDHKDEIHLCIVDVIMPKKSGREVYEAIQKIKPGTRVIFASGYTADKVQQERLPASSDFIAKPASPKMLLDKIREVLDSRKL